jgi:hypothetical protein
MTMITKWLGHVMPTRDTRIAHKVFVEIPEGGSIIMRPRTG